MLLLSIIDDFKANWFNQEMKNYFIKQIIENISTTDSFSNEGNPIIFTNALKEIMKQKDKLLQQPLNAVCRILNFNYLFHQLNKETIHTLLRKRFILMYIENQCSETKFGPEYLSIVQEQLYDILFDTLRGIPLQNSFKQIDINNEELKEFLGKYYDTTINSIDELTESLGIDRITILPKETISFILYLLTTIREHDRPMKLCTNFTLKY
ncbi:unnamed protein product [Rotaria sp. Silwood2]|nr:unnamed protein product [Rotaria sp. Silwood2]